MTGVKLYTTIEKINLKLILFLPIFVIIIKNKESTKHISNMKMNIIKKYSINSKINVNLKGTSVFMKGNTFIFGSLNNLKIN
jgi:hypothetical protein